jgi:hypothetical protein
MTKRYTTLPRWPVARGLQLGELGKLGRQGDERLGGERRWYMDQWWWLWWWRETDSERDEREETDWG